MDATQRLIVFAHDDAACEADAGQCPLGVHNTFTYAFETPFSSKGVDELMNVTFTCDVNRGWSNSDFVISNHFAVDVSHLVLFGHRAPSLQHMLLIRTAVLSLLGDPLPLTVGPPLCVMTIEGKWSSKY